MKLAATQLVSWKPSVCEGEGQGDPTTANIPPRGSYSIGVRYTWV